QAVGLIAAIHLGAVPTDEPARLLCPGGIAGRKSFRPHYAGVGGVKGSGDVTLLIELLGISERPGDGLLINLHICQQTWIDTLGAQFLDPRIEVIEFGADLLFFLVSDLIRSLRWLFLLGRRRLLSHRRD